MGRRSQVVQPDGGIVNYAYTNKGELLKTYWVRTYPAEYSYEFGRVKSMVTWKDFDQGQARLSPFGIM